MPTTLVAVAVCDLYADTLAVCGHNSRQYAAASEKLMGGRQTTYRRLLNEWCFNLLQRLQRRLH